MHTAIRRIGNRWKDSWPGCWHNGAIKVGSLKPGTTYIYESPDSGETVYARELGSTERHMIGQSIKAAGLVKDLEQDRMWGNIRRAAETNPALQDALDRAIVIYQLSKK